jgi:FKBP-type peptidyl-prolyl cis-trans isomerase 2
MPWSATFDLAALVLDSNHGLAPEALVFTNYEVTEIVDEPSQGVACLIYPSE